MQGSGGEWAKGECVCLCVCVCINLIQDTSKEDAAGFGDGLKLHIEIWRWMS